MMTTNVRVLISLHCLVCVPEMETLISLPFRPSSNEIIANNFQIAKELKKSIMLSAKIT